MDLNKLILDIFLVMFILILICNPLGIAILCLVIICGMLWGVIIGTVYIYTMIKVYIDNKKDSLKFKELSNKYLDYLFYDDLMKIGNHNLTVSGGDCELAELCFSKALKIKANNKVRCLLFLARVKNLKKIPNICF